MTTALWFLLGIALFLIAFNLLRLGVDAEYDGKTLFLRVQAGPVKRTILPKKQKPKKEKEKTEKPPKAEAEKKPTEKTKRSFSTLLELIQHVLEATGTFRRKLQVDLLRLHLRVGTDDPYNTAMYYAYLQAAVYGLHPLVERTLNVKERDVQLAPDFTGDVITATGRLFFSIRIGQIAAIATVLAWKVLRTILRQPKKKKKKSKPKGKAKTEPVSAERMV